MRGGEWTRSRLELDERARSARRCLEEAERELAQIKARTGFREWLLAAMRSAASRPGGTGRTS